MRKFKKEIYSQSQKKMLRFQFLEYINQVTIRTFNKDIYILRPGLLVQNVTTNQFKKISEIYYEVRTVRTVQGNVVAKRKNPRDELVFVKTKAS